jgi:hypothetical protein
MSDDSKKSGATSKTIWQAGLDALVESTPLIGPSAAAMMRAARDGEAAEDGSLEGRSIGSDQIRSSSYNELW